MSECGVLTDVLAWMLEFEIEAVFHLQRPLDRSFPKRSRAEKFEPARVFILGQGTGVLLNIF